MSERLDVQQIVVFLIVLGAVLFIARRVWRTIASARASRQANCGAGCGCDATHTAHDRKTTRA